MYGGRGVPSLFGKHEHLLIKPRSASSITEAVKGYLEGGNWQEAIAEELYQTVHEDYDAFKNAGKFAGCVWGCCQEQKLSWGLSVNMRMNVEYNTV